MDTPPPYGSPYPLVPDGTKNVGSEGVRIAWDGMRYFYGTVINQAWNDLANIAGTGVTIV